ncbi:hypothetical protein A2609_01810 [Candidatus Kaiserbacteria bacterium RIFOXYD1_FULL_47_14]|uniref:Uncharacterized protein n=1 Tax=Candidatus Kaiserbacteria bacterium RIFOXYD1_FULL_47_14 TaxID=1798533 RepID=A0A1F6G5U2_9BACT|nr:MAG: hypothetical protein A2609_01810 [Candidatus Kaiserbacteria bacterium RIFOXYD1_FULL_47_14]
MKNNLLFASILGVGLIVSSLIVVNGAFAQTTPYTIKYPITELGNCKSKDACKNYCDDPNHIDACVTFAEKNGMLSSEQLAEAKQVQAAIAKGIKPPACNGKKECDAYCEEPIHMKECISFGEASGFLKGKELQDAKKMIVAIDNGATPPACKGKEACDAYCSDRSHIEACMTFAQAAGLMTPEEAQNSEKMMAAIKKGFMPPDCRGKEACDAYCAESAHTDECINFSIAAGFMTEKEAEMAKKTGGKGPGGCIGKDACDAFCNTPDNQQTCMNFARDNGIISEEETQRMQEGQQKFKDSMQNIPAEVEDCMKTILGDSSFEKIKSGQTIPPRDMSEKVDSCFSKMGSPREKQPGKGGDIPPAGQGQMMAPGDQQTPGTQFVPRMEPGDGPTQGQDGEDIQFAPGTSANQPPSPEGQQAPGTLFVPRVEIEVNNQLPPEGTSGAYPNQQVQFAPGTQPMMPTSGGTEPTPLPTGSTAPQSFNFDLNSSFAAVITAFQESRF